MTNETDLLALLRGWGCRRKFKPYREPESGTVYLAVRRPATIVAGALVGSMIDLYAPGLFRVWTPRTKRARRYAAQYGLRIRNLDRESELFVPANLADSLLPAFGARARRALSEAARARLKAIGYQKHAQKGG